MTLKRMGQNIAIGKSQYTIFDAAASPMSFDRAAKGACITL